METGTTYVFPTGAGWLHVVRVGDTIFAFCEGEEPLVHLVPEPRPEEANWGPDAPPMPSRFAHLASEDITTLLVARVFHPTDTLIAFYEEIWEIGYGWGYVWDVDHPERSYWARSDRLADMIDPDDVPEETNLARLLVDIVCLTARTNCADPRATAFAAASSGYMIGVATPLPALRSWLEEFQTALDELEASESRTLRQ